MNFSVNKTRNDVLFVNYRAPEKEHRPSTVFHEERDSKFYGMYSMDTGSSIASIKNSKCSAKTTDGFQEVLKYADGSTTSRGMEYTNFMGARFRPVCAPELPYAVQDGRIGLSTTQNASHQQHSLMHAMPRKRLVLDKTEGTLCLGGECTLKPDATRYEFATEHGLDTEVVGVDPMDNNSHIVFDTGMEFSRRVRNPISGKSVCVVGYRDIDYLEVDFDRKQLKANAGGVCLSKEGNGSQTFRKDYPYPYPYKRSYY